MDNFGVDQESQALNGEQWVASVFICFACNVVSNEVLRYIPDLALDPDLIERIFSHRTLYSIYLGCNHLLPDVAGLCCCVNSSTSSSFEILSRKFTWTLMLRD